MGAETPIYGRRSFNEVAGIPSQKLSSVYYFTWYDMATSDVLDWILVSNPSSNPTEVVIKIGGQEKQRKTLNGGEVWTPTFAGVMAGPVEIVSVTGQSIYATQRVLYRGSFDEIPGIPQQSLSRTYYFNWYDSASPGISDWILVSNPSNAAANANVTISIAGTVRGTKTVAPGQTWTPVYPAVIGGPVEILSDQPIFASQRTLYDKSFSEVPGTAAENVGTSFYFPWYDYRSLGMKGDWVLISNPSGASADANITIKISGLVQGQKVLKPGETWTPIFRQVMGGPVEISSDQNIFVSQRVLYEAGFDELGGVAVSNFATSQYFPWYDQNSSGMIGDWLLIANSGQSDAQVSIKINGAEKESKIVSPGQIWTPQFSSTIGGPVEITSSQPIYVSQRVIYAPIIGARRAIGLSVEGRVIEASRLGSGGKKVLFVATHHGDEEGAGILNRLNNYLTYNYETIPQNTAVWIVPVLNPDGQAKYTRYNARGVDLNRNYATNDWGGKGTTYPAFTPCYPGPYPFSEPETSALSTLVNTEAISTLVSYHGYEVTTYSGGNTAGRNLAWLMGVSTGYGYYGDIEVSGDVTRWFSQSRGGPAVTVEVTYESEDMMWNRNLPAMKIAINY